MDKHFFVMFNKTTQKKKTHISWCKKSNGITVKEKTKNVTQEQVPKKTKKETLKLHVRKVAIRGPERPISTQKGIKHITGNENFTKRNNWDPKLVFPPNLVVEWGFVLSFLFPKRLHCCHIYFHYSYLYNHYNYSWTFCIRCRV